MKGKWARLSKLSSVQSKTSAKAIISVTILLLVILLIGWCCVMGSKSHKKSIPDHDQLINTQVVADNAKKIAQLESGAHQLKGFSLHQDGYHDLKPLSRRLHAPLCMFTAQITAQEQQHLTRQHNLDNGISYHVRQLKHPGSTLVQGELVHGVLETAINSDLPGLILAYITQPVYSYRNQNILIPKGSRIVGHYLATSTNGMASERIFVVWSRIISPQGLSIDINSPGADDLGQAGLAADAVNTHFFKVFKTAALLSLLGASVSGNQAGYEQNSYQSSVSNALLQSAQNTQSHSQNVKPTLHIHQGDAITIFVAHDIDFYRFDHALS